MVRAEIALQEPPVVDGLPLVVGPAVRLCRERQDVHSRRRSRDRDRGDRAGESEEEKKAFHGVTLSWGDWLPMPSRVGRRTLRRTAWCGSSLPSFLRVNPRSGCVWRGNLRSPRLRYRCPVGELGDLLEPMHGARKRVSSSAARQVTEIAFDEAPTTPSSPSSHPGRRRIRPSLRASEAPPRPQAAGLRRASPARTRGRSGAGRDRRLGGRRAGARLAGPPA